MGINFNTRVAEAVARIIVYAYLMAWVLIFNTRDVGESQSSRERHALK